MAFSYIGRGHPADRRLIQQGFFLAAPNATRTYKFAFVAICQI
jgi:hypothetical protein